MQLHQLKIKKAKNKKRIGRGGKRGTYSGRGQKGQKARSGRRIKPQDRYNILRLPKLRGEKNISKKTKPLIIKISDLLSKIQYNPIEVIDINTLKQLNLISAKFRGDIKIIGDNDQIPALIIKNIKISQKLKDKIVKAGGKIL